MKDPCKPLVVFLFIGEKGNTIITHRNGDCLLEKGVHQT